MSSTTEEKERLLRLSRRYQSLCQKLVDRGSSTIVCADANHTRFTVLWRKEQYAHLCGWEYYKDKAKRIPGPRKQFYDLLRKGVRLENRVKPTDPYAHIDEPGRKPDTLKWTREKHRVLPMALALTSATKVVVSAKGYAAIFFGNNEWALGLLPTDGDAYVPRTLFALSVENPTIRRKAKQGEIAEWDIQHIE